MFGEAAADRGHPGRERERDEVDGVVSRRGDHALVVARRVVDERAHEHGADSVGAGERRQRGGDPSSRARDRQRPEQQPGRQTEREREEDLGAEGELESEQRREPQDETAAVELAFEVAEEDERRQRHEEHRCQLQVRELVSEHVARKPEQVAARERGPERTRQVAAEQKGARRRERRQEDGGDVVGGRRAGRQRHRREQQGEPRHRGRPDEVAPGRRPERGRDEGIQAVQERVRPPAERPDEELRVAAAADQIAVEVRQNRDREVRDGEREIAAAGERNGPPGRLAARALHPCLTPALAQGRPPADRRLDPGALATAGGAASGGGAEDRVPPRSADAEAALVVLEVVAHVQLVQALPDPAARLPVMEREVEHVVEEIAREEAGADGKSERGAEDGDEDREEPGRERDRDDRWHDEPQWIARMIVVHAVKDPVEPRPELTLRLQVEHHPVDPVLAERPERIPTEERKRGLPETAAPHPEHRQDDDHRRVDERWDDRPAPCKGV